MKGGLLLNAHQPFKSVNLFFLSFYSHVVKLCYIICFLTVHTKGLYLLFTVYFLKLVEIWREKKLFTLNLVYRPYLSL